ncbi:hypothetical protein C8J57DRAFT_1733206 [Mycena rebaudengoi]|nr:hypothetical protein C8J57DRAFT_1733206 [Mycena rebaudengoi]
MLTELVRMLAEMLFWEAGMPGRRFYGTQWWVRARELAAQEARTSQLRRADETLRSASVRRRRWRLYNPRGRARAPADLGPLARGTITRAAGVLEILVDDNETLKRNNVELQQLLADAREDYRALQEEVEDQCVNPGSVSRAGTPSFSRHYHMGSVPAAMLSPTYGFKRSRASRQYNLLHPRRTAARFRRGLALRNDQVGIVPQHAPGPVPVPAAPPRVCRPDVAESICPHSCGGSHSPSSAASVYSDSLAPSTAPRANNHAANLTAARGSTSLGALIERRNAAYARRRCGFGRIPEHVAWRVDALAPLRIRAAHTERVCECAGALPAPTACAAETSRIACPCTHRLVSRGASHQQDPQPHRHRLLAPILRDNARYLAGQLHKSHAQFPVPFRGLHVLRHPRLPAAIHEGRGVLLRRVREADPCGVFPFDPPLTHTDGADEAHLRRQTSAHLVTDNKSMRARLAECPRWICAAGRVPSRTIASFCTTAKHINMSSLSAAMSRVNARLAPMVPPTVAQLTDPTLVARREAMGHSTDNIYHHSAIVALWA